MQCSLKTSFILASGILAFSILSALSSQEKPQPQTAAAPAQEELEKKFKEALTDAVLTGRWRLVKDGKLGEEKEEKYTITSAAKAGAELWIILARIQYGGKDVTLPVPVTVKWAGDTPVISITNAGLPGLGTYTARVLIYEGIYTGTWSASDHGGTLAGTIAKAGAQNQEIRK